jgi:hypothetical protein
MHHTSPDNEKQKEKQWRETRGEQTKTKPRKKGKRRKGERGKGEREVNKEPSDSFTDFGIGKNRERRKTKQRHEILI